jgi:signal transduction histidine kinase
VTDGLASQTVLVVDDRPDNRRRYRTLVEAGVGCNVAVADSKQAALQRLQSDESPALVLLDVCLPDPPDGCDVCRAVKRGQLRPEVQVVMITALRPDPEVIRQCLEAGADDFLYRDDPNDMKLARLRGRLQAQRNYTELIDARIGLQKQAAVTEFARALKHDVVNNRLGTLEWVLGQMEQHVKSVREAKDYAVRYIEALDRLAKAGGEPVLEPHDPCELVTDAVLVTRYNAMSRGVDVVWDPPLERDARVLADGPDVVFTLVELITNACYAIGRHRDQGGEAYRGVVSLRTESMTSGGVRIAVADNGPGVEPHRTEVIFEPGQTFRDGGTGLGLYFARQRIEKAGGTIRYEPNEPTGARFIIEFPEAPGQG